MEIIHQYPYHHAPPSHFVNSLMLTCADRGPAQLINYQHLLSLLRILNAQRTLLTAHDTFIWQQYRNLNPGAPGTSHQLASLAKALIKGGFYP